MRRRCSDLLLIGVLLLAGTAAAGDAPLPEGLSPDETPAAEYYQDAKGKGVKGWWWYEPEPPPKPKEEKKPEEKKEQPPPKAPHRVPDMKDYTVEQLWNLHPKDFQELLTDFQNKAIQKPSVGNVKDYLLMQDIARRKSVVFANVVGAVTQMNPEMNVENDDPRNVPGRNLKNRRGEGDVKKKIATAGSEFALLFFYADDCEYCDSQVMINNNFASRYPQLVVRSKNIEEHEELARKMGVSTVPYLVLVKKDDSGALFPIAAGIVALSTMEDRVYRAIRLLSGEITPEEYSVYEHEEGGPLDPTVLIKKERQQKRKKR